MDTNKDIISGWRHGEKISLAKKTGLKPSYISDIFNRKTTCSKQAALKILKVAKGMKLKITLNDLMFIQETKNLLFKALETQETDDAQA